MNDSIIIKKPFKIILDRMIEDREELIKLHPAQYIHLRFPEDKYLLSFAQRFSKLEVDNAKMRYLLKQAVSKIRELADTVEEEWGNRQGADEVITDIERVIK